MGAKRNFGVSALLGSGLGLIVTLTWFFLLADADLGVAVATVTAGGLSGAFVFVGYWMYRAGIAEDTVWTVARWCLLGLSIPTVVGVALLTVDVDAAIDTLFPGVFINVIAVGGVLGLLLGLVVEMHREQSVLRQLNQRNQVLNRVLRHNIRNDMHVVQWHLELIEDGQVDDDAASIEAIKRKIDEVVQTSDTARRIDELASESSTEEPVDVVELVEERMTIVRAAHPEATVDVDVPETARADVGPLFESAIDNVVENAIEHNDGDPHIDVGVDASGDGSTPVRVTVTDDGPGIPESEVDLLDEGYEAQLEHSTGLGLWLVKWVVEHYDGRLRIETPEDGGTRVVMEVPGAASDRGRPSTLREATRPF